MRSFLIKRILLAIGVVFAISAITFFVLNIVPGDPVRIMVGEMADDATVERIREQMGLNDPVHVQYARWLTNMLQGDFGTSYTQSKPVVTLMGQAFLTTARLAGLAYVFALVLGLLCATTRMMQGAHFASHNVATMLIDWLVSAALYVLCFDRRHVIGRLTAGIAGPYSLSGVIVTTALWWTLVLNAPLFKAAAPVASIDALALMSLMLALFLGSALVLTAASILPREIFAACLILLSAAGAASAACMASGEPAGLCCSRDLAQAARSLTPGSAAVFLAIIAPPLWAALRLRPAAKDGSGAARSLTKLAVAGVMAVSVFLLVESNASDLKGILDAEHRLLNHMAPLSILGCAFDSLSSNSWGAEHLFGSVFGSTGAP